jgi:WD40 repeat protein
LAGVILIVIVPYSWDCTKRSGPTGLPKFNQVNNAMLIASTYGTVEIWSFDGHPLIHFQNKINNNAGAPDSRCIYALGYAPDGKTIAISNWDKTITLWDAHTGQYLRSLEVPTDAAVSVIGFSPDSMSMLGMANTVYLWDLNTGRIRHSISRASGFYQFRYAPDAQSYYLIGQPSSLAEITITHWSVATGALQSTITIKSRSAVSHDGTLVFSIEAGMIVVRETATGKIIRSIQIDAKAKLDHSTLSLSPDNHKLVLDKGFDPPQTVIDLSTGKMLYEVDRFASAVEFSPDQKTILYHTMDAMDGLIYQADAQTGKRLRTFEIYQSKRALELIRYFGIAATFLPDGKTIIAGSYPDPLRLYDAQTGELIRPLCPLVLGRRWIAAGVGLCAVALTVAVLFVWRVIRSPIFIAPQTA